MIGDVYHFIAKRSFLGIGLFAKTKGFLTMNAQANPTTITGITINETYLGCSKNAKILLASSDARNGTRATSLLSTYTNPQLEQITPSFGVLLNKYLESFIRSLEQFSHLICITPLQGARCKRAPRSE